MAITFVNYALSDETTAGTSHSINLPTHIGGDWVGVLIAQSDESGVTWTPPADWMEVIDANDDTPGYGFYLAWRIAPKGGLGASVTFIASKSVGFRACAVSYRGVRTTTPIEAISSASVNASETTPESPTITTLTDDAMVVRLLTLDGSETITVPSGNTERAKEWGTKPGNGSSVAWADKPQATAGSAGSAEWDLAFAEQSITLSFALAEGGSATVTLEPWALWTVTQMRSDMAPGASGWDWLTEEDAMEDIINDAQVIVDVPEALRVGVRNIIVWRLIADIEPTATGLRELESETTAGLMNAALIAIEDDLLNHPEVVNL